MNSYSMLECLVPFGETRTAIGTYPEIDGIDSWLSGSRFDRAPAGPIELQWDPETDGPRKSFYDATIPLMRQDLIDILRGAGVDNLDTYPVSVVDVLTGEVDPHYSAVNVIGVVRAADLTRSRFSDPSRRRRIDMDFDSLVVNQHAPRGAMMFRLGECTSGLLVRADLRARLEGLGTLGLTFVEPENWVG
jgi:hypothetical protein